MKIIKYILSTLIVLVFITSCNDFLDVNEDPNNPTEVSVDLILPTALQFSAQSQYGRRTNAVSNFFMTNWSQAKGFSYFDDDFQYNPSSTYYSGIWNWTYGTCLTQYADIDRNESDIENYIAIAKIMKAFHFQTLVDTYGDIPYFEALQRGDNPTPAYDDALSIYDNLILELDAALALIGAAENNINTKKPNATDDIMFSGNMDKWKQFANTVKLRVLVRQSDLSSRQTYISEQITNIINEGSGFITSDVAINPGYVAEVNKQNPFWNRFGYDSGGTITNSNEAACATPYVLNKLTSLSDSRIDYIYALPSSGLHRGVAQGSATIDDADLPENVSSIGPGLLKSASQDAIMFTLAESYFLQAEAQLKAILPGDAKASFNSGVEASYAYLGAGTSSAYTSNGLQLSDYDASTNKMEAIIVQKWIALNGIDAAQSWFDWSRTGYPNDLPMSETAVNNARPVRLHYPATETTGNAGNLPTQPNIFTDKIFWANN